MIEFCEISKIFDSDLLKKPFTALDNVSFKIEEGKIIGFLGANGAGKTTSLKILMDFIRPNSGEVKFGNSLGGSKKEAFKLMGYLPERPFFYPHLTGREFCFYMGLISELKRSEINEKIAYWAPRFKIDFALDREIKGYSKGMLQRIGFLATLLHDPKLIVLDEPLSGVDPIGRKELKDIILEVNKMGKTIFFSSHIVSDMEEVCNNVVCLRNGKMVFQGNIDEMIKDHIKPHFYITYADDKEVHRKEIDQEQKDDFLKTLIEKNNKILKVEQHKPTLEQIFYNIK